MKARIVMATLVGNLFKASMALAAPSLPQGLEVVADNGLAVPASPYFQHMVAAPSHPAVMDGTEFPLRTRLLPAVLKADVIKVFEPLWLTTPVFLVGTDDISQRWLIHNRKALMAMSAQGLVVQADSTRSFKDMQVLCDGMALVPTHSEWLEQVLLAAGAAVFPLLIQLDGTVVQIVPQPTVELSAQQTNRRTFKRNTQDTQ
jgi:integrating conjugative element protein (TIGR03765 family)